MTRAGGLHGDGRSSSGIVDVLSIFTQPCRALHWSNNVRDRRVACLYLASSTRSRVRSSCGWKIREEELHLLCLELPDIKIISPLRAPLKRHVTQIELNADNVGAGELSGNNLYPSRFISFNLSCESPSLTLTLSNNPHNALPNLRLPPWRHRAYHRRCKRRRPRRRQTLRLPLYEPAPRGLER